MTTIGSHPVRRETSAIARGRPIIIELHPWGVRIREKGRRFHYEITYGQIYDAAAKIKMLEQREARAMERKIKRTNRPIL